MEDNSQYIEPKIINGNRYTNQDCQLKERYNTSLIVASKFVNLSSKYLVITFRDGTYTVLPPDPAGPYSDSLVIGHSKSNNLSKISVIDTMECETIEMIRGQLMSNNSAYFYWEEMIDVKLLKDNRGGIYVPHADIVVCLYELVATMSLHPFCKQRTHNFYLNRADNFDPQTDICTGVRLIDNENKYLLLYCIFNDRIALLTSKQSNTLESGIYITGLSEIIDSTSNSIRKDIRYDINEALEGKCPIRVYTSILEAQSDLNKIQNGEIAEKILSKDHEKLMAELKRVKEQLEHENNVLKLEQAKEENRFKELEKEKIRELQRIKTDAEQRILEIKEKASMTSSGLKTAGEVFKLLAVGLAVYKILL